MSAYHHGNLRRAVVDRALAVVAAEGPAALNFRRIAEDIGVSHTAPRYHFGNSRAVLTTIATEGFEKLRDHLSKLRADGAPCVDRCVAYVEFAVNHRAHFTVMFEPSLLDTEDPAFMAASDGAFAELRACIDAPELHGAAEDAAAAVVAAWSLAHGLATLTLTGSLDRARIRKLVAGGDVSAVARQTAEILNGFPPRHSGA